MKRILFCLALVAVLPLPNAFASNVDFSLGINIGNRPAVVPLPPTPVYEPAPVYQEPPAYQEDSLEMEAPPLFIQPPELGFNVAVGIPRDIFFYNNNYYLYQGNAWFISPCYRGPWHVTRYNSIPWVLRKHPTARIRYYRDAGYRHYQKVRSPYWERHHFRPQRDLKEARYSENKSWNSWGKQKQSHSPHQGRYHGRP
ncbi:MAG: hypothetical protein EG828_14160 [Deltaproteobacteria bacterium]|nr:hypothetical protein [Deltaproteobacteria bacterium]